MSSSVNELPLVTIIIPTYNAERYLARTLSTVASQTYTNYELVIVDDKSTDSTLDVALEYADIQPNVRVISLDSNSGGPATPRNVGISCASGSYVAFLDADDLWHPQKLEIQLSFLQDYSADAICSSSMDFNEEYLEGDAKAHCNKYVEVSYFGTLCKSRVPLSSLIIKTELAKKIKFNARKEFIAREDYLFTLEFLKNMGRLYKIDYPLMRYRKHNEQISSRKILMAKRQYITLVYHLSYLGFIPRYICSIFFLATHIWISIYLRRILKVM